MTVLARPAPEKEAAATEAADEQTLYKHTKKPEWGLAILAWERADQRGYQFGDGRLRAFKEGFYHLMEPADVDESVERRMAIELEETLDAREGQKQKSLEPAYPFSAQLEIFRKLYPKGFQGDAWREKHRGQDGKELKRHREAAVERARELLAQDALDALVEADQADEIVDRAVELLKSTNLVSLKKARSLDELEGPDRKAVGIALHQLLYGEKRFGQRFRAWVQALRKGLDSKLGWRLVTALPALVHPDDHTCVRPSAYKKQAAVFEPDRLYSRRPMRTSYSNYQRVVEQTRERLVEEGFEPRDLLDVHDFIWVTLRPSAVKHLEDEEASKAA